MRTVLACLILLAAPPCAAWARPAPLDFHGLRVGMTPAQVEAAGYPLMRRTEPGLGMEGYVVGAERVPQAVRMTMYFHRNRLFQLAVDYRPLDEAAARAFAAELFRRYGGPESADEVMRVTVRWVWGKLTYHFGFVRSAEAVYTPSLMITDEAIYREVISEVPEPNCVIDSAVCGTP